MGLFLLFLGIGAKMISEMEGDSGTMVIICLVY